MIASAFVIFAVACILPPVALVGSLLAQLLARSTDPAALVETRHFELLANSALLGAGSAVLATLIGVPLGILFARVELPSKNTWRVLLAAPLILPPYIAGLAWVAVERATGWVWIHSMPGGAMVMALVFYPLSMLATETAIRRIDPQLEDAARTVMPERAVLRRITLPLSAPAIIGAALFVFVLAISEFGIPALLRLRVFTTEIFTAFAAFYDFSRAVVMVLPLLLLSTIAAAAAVAVAGRQVVATSRGRGLRDGSTHQAHPATAILLGTTAAVVIVPLLVLGHEARGVRSWTTITAGAAPAIINSLLLATIGATMTTAVACVLGYARARAGRRAGVVADVAFVVLFAMPSTIVGIGLIALWNRASPFGILYGTQAMLVLVSLARFLPLAGAGLAAAVRQVPRSHEEAAAVSGARWLGSTIGIVAPQLSNAIAATWVIVFVLAFGELGASLLVVPPGVSTLPIHVYTLIANAPPANVAALALLQALVALLPLVLLAWGLSRARPL